MHHPEHFVLWYLIACPVDLLHVCVGGLEQYTCLNNDTCDVVLLLDYYCDTLIIYE